jgi:quinol monooxygenase YgiN
MVVDLFKFSVKPGFSEKVIGHMKEHTELTRDDEGCLFVHSLQSNTDENTLYMLLGWEDQESVEKHMATDHDLQFRNNVDDYIYAPPTQLDWKVII